MYSKRRGQTRLQPPLMMLPRSAYASAVRRYSIDATSLFKGADVSLLIATVLLVLILLLLIYRSPILAVIPLVGVPCLCGHKPAPWLDGWRGLDNGRRAGDLDYDRSSVGCGHRLLPVLHLAFPAGAAARGETSWLRLSGPSAMPRVRLR